MGNIDWGLVVAVIAVILGGGSLYLTWQSTKSAKKAIDTSIELYEKQKNDDDVLQKSINEKKLSAKKKIIENEIIDCYMKYMGFYDVCSAIKSRSNFEITLGYFANSIVIAIDNERNDGVRSLIYLPNLDFSNEFLDELYFLDEPLAEKIASLKGYVFRCSNLINHIVGCVEQWENDNVYLKYFVEKFEHEIDEFKYELEKIHKLCSSYDVSLEEKHRLAHM